MQTTRYLLRKIFVSSVVLAVVVLFCGPAFPQNSTGGGPSFYPKNNTTTATHTLPDTSSNQVDTPTYQFNPYPYTPSYTPDTDWSPSPSGMIDSITRMASAHGLWNTMGVVMLLFFLQYAWSNQKRTVQREKFLQEQINQSDSRLTSEMMKVQMHLDEVDKNLQTFHDQLSRNSEVVSVTAKASKEVVDIVVNHSRAVEHALEDLNTRAEKLNHKMDQIKKR